MSRDAPADAVREAALAIAGAGLVLGVLAATVGFADLLRGVDHGRLLLGDFRGYYLPQGEALSAGEGQIHGFFATPFVAACMALLAALERSTATSIWAAVTATSLIAAVGLSGVLVATRCPVRGRAAAAFGVGAAMAASVPLLHIARWGQVSGPSLALVLVAAVSLGRPALAGLSLGLAIACKPWAALALVVVDRRVGGLALGVAGLAVFVVPMPWLGFGGAFRFALDVAADIAESEQYLAVDPNSQSLVHVLLRWVRVPAADRGPWWPWLAPFGYVLAIGFLVRLRRHRLGGIALPTALLATPAVTPTAWPSDLLAAIPVAVGVLASGGLGSGARRRWSSGLAIAAVVLMSWPVQRAFGGHRWHGGLAIPLLAVLAAIGAVALVGGTGDPACGITARGAPGRRPDALPDRT